MSINNLVTVIIRRLKNNPEYRWESHHSLRDLLIILYGRARQLTRGATAKLFIGSKGLVFKGSHVVIKHAHLLSAGKNLILEDNVYINALSVNGIRIKNNVSIGRNCTIICTGVISQKGTGISIGNNTGINAHCFLAGQGGIEIGDHVIIGPGSKIFSEDHIFSDTDIIIKDQGVSRSGVVIKNNCWIGAGVTILDGVTIGEGCVIAAGSVVTRSVPPYTIIAGVPGKVIKNRKNINEEGVEIAAIKNLISA